MNKDLDKIIAWAKVHSPQTLQHLNPPASDDDIKAVESAVGYQLPIIFKELLKQFDGEDGQSWLALFGNGNQMLSCKMIIEQHKIGQEIAEQFDDPEMETIEFWKDRVEENIIFVKGAVKPLLRHPKWLPFTSMNGDVFRYLDFDPAPGGVEGQVIEIDPEGCSYQVLENSIEEILAMYANQLEAGEYKVDQEGYIELIGQENDMNWGMPGWLKDIE